MLSDKDVERQAEFIRAQAKREGSNPIGDAWLHARYNEPKWPRGPFRRNDIMLQLDESSIELWRGVPWEFIDRIVALKV